ncbi:MAG: hypothetical protein HOD92_19740 [Deltaproteobacteria bacterium]|nr:hypothetical protein [Deltaproteobacteria bacterium]
MKLPSEHEQQIQDEIRRRILETDQKQANQEIHTEETQATLDALESITNMPRKEMERIAKAVEEEFKIKASREADPPNHPRKSNLFFYCLLISLGFATVLFFRRGSLLYLFFGVPCICAIYFRWRKRK